MAHRLIHFTFYRNAPQQTESSADLVLLWNLGGPVQVDAGGGSVQMKKDDVLSLMPHRSWTVQGQKILLAAFVLDDAQLRACFPRRNYSIRCNSAQEVNDNYDLLRKALGQTLQVWAEQGIYLEAQLNRLYYELLILLVNHFSVNMPGEPGSRAEQFAQYIEDHFQEELSLRQMGEAFHMTPEYFSRQFKREMGQTFYRTLTAVRLRHAKQALAETDVPLLRLALDNGFANLESFYRYFQQDTGQTPQAWRAANRRRVGVEDATGLTEVLGSLQLVQTPQAPQEDVLQVDAANRQPYHPFWREVLHLGDPALVDSSLIASQLQGLQSEIKFHFIRVRVDCRDFVAGGEYAFYNEERWLDYLLDHSFGIWFYVDYRQQTDLEQLYAYLDRLFSHFANRYSIQNIQKWRLELVYNTVFTTQKAQAYWACRQRLQAILNKYDCREPLLCAGLALGAQEALASFCQELERRGEKLSRLTMEAEPYIYYETGQGPGISRATDSSYLKNQLLTLRQNLPYFRDVVQDIYITSWTDNMLTLNTMNDSCYKGANLLKTIIDCFGRVRSLAHNIPLDAIYPDQVKQNILFGGNGLISQHGIPKPPYYAYSFLCHMGEYYLTHDSHSIVFAGKEGNCQILCHNCKRLNYKYYLDEQQNGLGDLDRYFEDLEPITLRYRLTGVRNGRYILKQRTVCTEAGSVQDQLREMGAVGGIYVHSHDLEYLREVSVPRIHLQEKQVTNGTMSVELTVPANAFIYLHIIYQY